MNENLILELPNMNVDEEAVNDFLDGQKIDAVLCVNEIFAVHSMKLAKRKGFKIPEDISFIGFTDGILSKYASPSLTAVAQHGQKMGEIAAQMLIEKVEADTDEENFRTEILEATLMERESTIN